MKNKILLVLFVITMLSCRKRGVNGTYCREVDTESVPSEALVTFAERFPNASHIKWYDRMDHYVAVFNMDKMEKKAEYDLNGNFILEEGRYNNCHAHDQDECALK